MRHNVKEVPKKFAGRNVADRAHINFTVSFRTLLYLVTLLALQQNHV